MKGLAVDETGTGYDIPTSTKVVGCRDEEGDGEARVVGRFGDVACSDRREDVGCRWVLGTVCVEGALGRWGLLEGMRGWYVWLGTGYTTG